MTEQSGVRAIFESNIQADHPRAFIFTKPNCGYCVKAKALFEKNNIHYQEISAVDNRDTLIEMVTEITGQPPKQVPQIFIDQQYVGGHDQLVIWLQERENAVRSDEG